jgi:hypothetical protein
MGMSANEEALAVGKSLRLSFHDTGTVFLMRSVVI